MKKRIIILILGILLISSFLGVFPIQTSLAAPPILSNPYPVGNQNVPYNPTLRITVNDPENDPLTVTFKTNTSGTWQTLGTYNDGNKEYTQNTTNMDSKNKKYYWSINVTDGIVWTNSTYSFIAQAFVLRWSANINVNTTKLKNDSNYTQIF